MNRAGGRDEKRAMVGEDGMRRHGDGGLVRKELIIYVVYGVLYA